MSKRKPIDKDEARERRNNMLDSAAKAKLSLTEGVREMRAISGMTQEDFARHRGVSARVIKALELGQGNPTVATMNRIGDFFGLEVGFVPVRRSTEAPDQARSAQDLIDHRSADDLVEILRKMTEDFETRFRTVLESQKDKRQAGALEAIDAPIRLGPLAGKIEAKTAPVRRKSKPRVK